MEREAGISEGIVTMGLFDDIEANEVRAADDAAAARQDAQGRERAQNAAAFRVFWETELPVIIDDFLRKAAEIHPASTFSIPPTYSRVKNQTPVWLFFVQESVEDGERYFGGHHFYIDETRRFYEIQTSTAIYSNKRWLKLVPVAYATIVGEMAFGQYFNNTAENFQRDQALARTKASLTHCLKPGESQWQRPHSNSLYG